MMILTIGTFDLLHRGHLRLIDRAAAFGELTVGVNSDRFVTEYKGRAAALSENERMAQLMATTTARVVLNDGPGVELIEEHKPDLIVIGSDWLERDYLAQLAISRERLDELNTAVLFLPRTPDISTTELRAT